MKQLLFIVVTSFVLNVVLSNSQFTCISRCVSDSKCKDKDNAASCVSQCVKSCSEVNGQYSAIRCNQCVSTCSSLAKESKPICEKTCNNVCSLKKENTLSYFRQGVSDRFCLPSCYRRKNCRRGEECENECRQYCESINGAPKVLEESKPPKTLSCVACLRVNCSFGVGAQKICQACSSVCSGVPKPTTSQNTAQKIKCLFCKQKNGCLGKNTKCDKCSNECSVATPPFERVNDENKVLSFGLINEKCKICLKKEGCGLNVINQSCHSKCKQQCLPPQVLKPVPTTSRPTTPAPTTPRPTTPRPTTPRPTTPRPTTPRPTTPRPTTPRPTTPRPTTPAPTTPSHEERKKCFACFRRCLEKGSKFGDCKKNCNNDCKNLKQ